MSVLTAIGKHLGSRPIGVDFDETGVSGNCFIATMPSAPDLAVGIFPSGGIPWTGHSAIATDEPTVQIRVRSIKHDPRPGLDLAEAIYGEMVGLHGLIDEGGEHETNVRRCLALQTGPVPIGKDDNQRPEFTLNFAIRIRNLTTHRT